MHPRTRRMIDEFGLADIIAEAAITLLDPLPYRRSSPSGRTPRLCSPTAAACRRRRPRSDPLFYAAREHRASDHDRRGHQRPGGHHECEDPRRLRELPCRPHVEGAHPGTVGWEGGGEDCRRSLPWLIPRDFPASRSYSLRYPSRSRRLFHLPRQPRPAPPPPPAASPPTSAARRSSRRTGPRAARFPSSATGTWGAATRGRGGARPIRSNS